MQFVLWLSICAAISIFSGKRTYIPLILATVLWFCIPWVASDLLTGIPPKGLGPIPSMHPGTWLILLTFVLRLVAGKSGIPAVINEHSVVFLTLGIFLLLAFALTATGSGFKGAASLVYIFVCPIMFSILILVEQNKSSNFPTVLRNTILLIATAQGVLGIVQYLTKSVIFFDSYYSRQYWWSETLSRSIGSTDHPIMLSILMCAGIALSMGMRSALLRMALPLFFIVPVIFTGSRVGLIVAAAVVAWVILVGPIGWIARILLMGALSFAIFLTFSGAVLQGAFGRFEDDSGSTRVRLLAYDLFGDVWPDYLYLGGGATHSYDLLGAAGLETSFESSGLTYAIDYGVIPIILYFVAMGALAFNRYRRKKPAIPGSAIAFTAVFIQFQSYSGGTIQSSASTFLWLLVALSACSLTPTRKNSLPNRPAQKVSV